ncbi:aminotransferase class V-fold PLP-dependent enzyme [Asanoa sp. NPDC050611]|uniref:aminotransferase class V-fold PLP-dependent enzyme n=1 Tax=Asanoa sp. NPDC050611 TaxID=3157098 RepID=UPI0033CF7BDC
MTPLAPPGDIPVLADRVWLYTGAEGPPLAAQDEALRRYLANRGRGEAGRAAHAEVEQRLRGRLAALLGLPAPDIALVSNASEALNLVARSLRTRAGDNVVVNDLEYPSVVQPWLRLAEQGVEVRVARHAGVSLPAESLAGLVDERTRAVAVSHVSYQSGWRHDVAAIAAAAHRVGAAVVLDATQSLGVVPVPAGLADVVVASSYKWMLGGHGLGVLAWNTARRPLPQPPAVGWRSVGNLFADDRFERYHLHADARRFEVGFPAYPTIYALDAALAWLAGFPPADVERHVVSLSGRLVGELSARGWDLLTPDDPARRAGNVAVRSAAGEELARVLATRGIHCWGGDGRLRASVHLFNGDADVDALLDALDSLPADLGPRKV